VQRANVNQEDRAVCCVLLLQVAGVAVLGVAAGAATPGVVDGEAATAGHRPPPLPVSYS
jgi:hypothetical protein